MIINDKKKRKGVHVWRGERKEVFYSQYSATPYEQQLSLIFPFFDNNSNKIWNIFTTGCKVYQLCRNNDNCHYFDCIAANGRAFTAIFY
uniref:Uncharacterized protein n=1 Tax=Romanomermis culicivorax TaxID=13658 RepID=A0A915L675_ROMCU